MKLLADPTDGRLIRNHQCTTTSSHRTWRIEGSMNYLTIACVSIWPS
jgi:hypothetical protein